MKILVINSNYSYSYSLVIRRNLLQDCNEPVTAMIVFRINTVIIAPPTVVESIPSTASELSIRELISMAVVRVSN